MLCNMLSQPLPAHMASMMRRDLNTIGRALIHAGAARLSGVASIRIESFCCRHSYKGAVHLTRPLAVRRGSRHKIGETSIGATIAANT